MEASILLSDPTIFNSISTKYSLEKTDKKIGKKKIAIFKKQTIDILRSETLKNYSKFLTSMKLPINPQNPSDISNLKTLNIIKTSIPSVTFPFTLNINKILSQTNSIHSIDLILCTIISYHSPDILSEQV